MGQVYWFQRILSEFRRVSMLPKVKIYKLDSTYMIEYYLSMEDDPYFRDYFVSVVLIPINVENDLNILIN